MPTWDSSQYLRFAGERTRPAQDLAARIAVDSPRHVVDLGCGPGNSTAVLAERWPAAQLVGVDNSPAMIETAQRARPHLMWQLADIATWSSEQPVDVLFSNAALQWVSDHTRVLPHLLHQVKTGGACAFQVPANFDAPGHRIIREIGGTTEWRTKFLHPVREWHVEEPSFYYDTLAPHARRLDIWVTEYQHVLPSAEAIIEWYRGTGLRPWLDALPDERTRDRFIADYRSEIVKAFPPQADECVLFPFRRLFAIAYR